MPQGIERRFAPTELRAARKDGATMPTIEGHAAVFDSLSVELWGFFEEIAPGAFADSIEAGKVLRLMIERRSPLASQQLSSGPSTVSPSCGS